MTSLRAAVVGTGFGCRVHVPVLRNAGFDVVALVGRDPDRTMRRAERLGIPVATASLDEVLDLVDAVTIATPPDTHAALSMAALAAGKAVICEKPFALSAREASAMRDAAEASGVPAFVGHEFRWAEDRAVVERTIADGAIGEPRLATFVSFNSLVADPSMRLPAWWFDASRGGGWLGASGSHVIDQIRTALGAFEWVEAGLPLVSDRPDGVAEDSLVVRARMVNGCDVVIQSSAGTWGPTAAMTRVAGTRGTIWTDDAGGVLLADGEGTHAVPVPDDLRLDPPLDPSDDPRHRYTHLELGPYSRLAEAFAAAIEGRVPPAGPRPATFADGVAVMEVIDAIRRAASTGQRHAVPAPPATGSA